MAEDKKSFLLYSDLIHTVRKMNREERGDLFMTILEYVNDENPVIENNVIDLVFEPIKRQLKRDLEKYECKRKQWSQAGKASASKRTSTDVADRSTDDESRSTDSTVNVNVNVNDTVNDNVSKEDNTIEGRMKKFFNSLIPFVEEFTKETVREFYEYWTEHSPKGRKMRFEKETVFDIKKRLVTWKNNEKKKFAGGGAKTGKKQQIMDAVKPAYENLMEKFENEGK